MKGAAIIYSFVGLALLFLDASATFSKGFGLGTLFYAALGAACLVLARGLFLARPLARLTTLITSAFVALGFGGLALRFYLTAFPTSPKVVVPQEFWRLLGLFSAISLVFGLAFVLSLRPSRHALPNSSFKRTADRTPR